MSFPPLTSRERMWRILVRRDHDRIPRHDGFWTETIARWQAEGLAGDAAAVLRQLQDDRGRVCWSSPVPFPGREEILREDADTKVVRGSQGKTERVWKNRSGTPEHIEFGCDSPVPSRHRSALAAAGAAGRNRGG